MTNILKLEHVENWVYRYQRLIGGSSFIRDDRKMVSLSLLHASLEHNFSILTLVKTGTHGSALALLRPQCETFLRGTWMSRCSSDEAIKDFMNEKSPPPVKQLLQGIEDLEEYPTGKLSEFMSEIRKLLHDFTHGGLYQSAFRDKGDRIAHGLEENQLDWLIRNSTFLSFLACLEISSTLNDSQLLKKIIESFNEIIKKNA